MITADIEGLKDWILINNKYFNTGFADAWQDPISGQISVGEDERISVGLDDRYGNYFYIRVNEEIGYSASREQLRDGIISTEETARCFLVAIVKKAAPKELARCLLNSLIRYQMNLIRPIRSIIKREQVIANEMKGMEKEDLQYVLSNLAEVQAVLIEFQLTTIFHSISDKCPCEPCINCNDE